MRKERKRRNYFSLQESKPSRTLIRLINNLVSKNFRKKIRSFLVKMMKK